MIARIVAAFRSNPVAWLALFVALGGTSLAASRYKITSTSQINPKVIKKLKGNAGAPGPRGPIGPAGPAGTPDSSKFFTKTESDGRFLAKGAPAADSAKLGGVAPSGYLQGTGRMVSGRVAIPVGSSVSLVELDFAHIEAVCEVGSVPVLRLVAELPLENVVYWSTNSGAAPEIQTANAVGAGSFLEAVHTTPTPQSVTWQASYNDGADQIATAWTTDQDEGGTCVFTGQAITTL
jgi:hypothetical protein